MRFLLSVALVCMLLAGCNGPSDPAADPTQCPAPQATTASGSATDVSFDSLPSGACPVGWQQTGGRWSVEADSEGTGKLVRGTGDMTKGRSSLLDTPAGLYDNFEATVRFNLVSGEHPQGAGLSFRFADEKHYMLIRFSTAEQGWHLFVADGGEADKKGDATQPLNATLPVVGDWVDLKVIAIGPHIEGWWGEHKVIEYTELSLTAARSGTAGLFLRGQTVALFDDFAVKPLP